MKKIGIIIFSVIIAALLGSSYFLITADLNIKQGNQSDPESILKKIEAVQLQGGKLEITQEDINYAVSFYKKNILNEGNYPLKDIIVNINNSITVYCPALYKGHKIWLSVQGYLFMDNNQLKYIPDKFKAGNFPISKGIVMSYLKKYKFKDLEFTDTYIAISSSKLPFKLNSIQIINNRILMDVPKLAFDSTTENYNLMAPLKTNEIKTNPSESELPDASSPNSYSSGKVASSKVSKLAGSLIGQLNSASRQCANSRERAVIRAAVHSINKLASDPSYSHIKAKGSVRAAYSKLSAEEKKELKKILMKNVDADNAMQIMSLIR